MFNIFFYSPAEEKLSTNLLEAVALLIQSTLYSALDFLFNFTEGGIIVGMQEKIEVSFKTFEVAERVAKFFGRRGVLCKVEEQST